MATGIKAILEDSRAASSSSNHKVRISQRGVVIQFTAHRLVHHPARKRETVSSDDGRAIAGKSDWEVHAIACLRDIIVFWC